MCVQSFRLTTLVVILIVFMCLVSILRYNPDLPSNYKTSLVSPSKSNPMEDRMILGILKEISENEIKSEHEIDSNLVNLNLPIDPIDPNRTIKENENKEVITNNLTASKLKLYTVTYASHGGKDDRFCRAVESAIRNNFDLIILGWKIPWKGLSQKLQAAHEFASSLNENDLMLFTDAFDVLFADSPASIIDKFMEIKADILFAGECGCWPHVVEDKRICFDKYPKAPTPYRYLNSGTWIGKAHVARDMLAEVIRAAGNTIVRANDQKLVADMFMSGRFGISLDYYSRIFQSMHLTLDPPLPHCNPRSDLTLTKAGKWYNQRTNSTPAIFHFNGGGKQFHLKMEGKAWYKRKDFNSHEERVKLAAHMLNVPSQVEGKLRFDEICKNYVKI